MMANSHPADRNLLPEGPALLPGASFAYVFGSFGTPRFSEESDIDIAVDLGRPMILAERAEISSRLESTLGHRVDLLDAFTADPIIALQVLKGGRLLFIRRKADLYRFQMKTLASYLDEKLDRRVAEDAMLGGVKP